MGRTLAIGDIHGARHALAQVLYLCNYDPASDQIIFLGDVVDGWPETKEAVDMLLDMPNLIHLLGNHDEWCRKWMRNGWQQPIWENQGGRSTIQSYAREQEKSWWDTNIWPNVPDDHAKYFEEARPYYVDEERNFLFVHAGFIPDLPLDEQGDELWWIREFWYAANARAPDEKLTEYDKVFIGHTSLGANGPARGAEVWNLDTGAGWEGVLTVMDVDTEEYWQSDLVVDMYPNAVGRR